MPAVKMPDGKVVMLSDDPAEGAKQFAELELLMSPSAQQQQQPQSNSTEQLAGTLGEAGKGAMRGLASMGQAVSSVFDGATVAGQPVNPLQNPDIQKLGEHFVGMMGRDPNASEQQHAWGTAGEIGGGALLGGSGGKASLSMFEKAAPKAAQLAAPQLSKLQDMIATTGGGALGHMLGGGYWGSMVARYGIRAVMKALQKAPEEAGGASIPNYGGGGGLSPEMLARMTAGGVQPLFSQGEQ